MKVAALQMVSSACLESNLETAERLIAEACANAAELVLLPEYWPFLGIDEQDKLAVAEPFGCGRVQQFLSGQAQRHGIYLIGGTVALQASQPGKVLNSCLVYHPDGNCMARYDKMHLFGFSREQESYDEARTIEAGETVGTVELPIGRVALSVCYDLRFPEYYRRAGECSLIVVPSAFTYTTGRAHWEILLRARAIENQCYVLAAGQGGLHQNGRRTWGHSMLIDPWGEVVAVLPEGEGWLAGELSQERLAAVRAMLPALRHRRL